jgi:hypothetical protein
MQKRVRGALFASAAAVLATAEWRERAAAGATTVLKERERDDRDDEIARAALTDFVQSNYASWPSERSARQAAASSPEATFIPPAMGRLFRITG